MIGDNVVIGNDCVVCAQSIGDCVQIEDDCVIVSDSIETFVDSILSCGLHFYAVMLSLAVAVRSW